jgi:hypothetical protein
MKQHVELAIIVAMSAMMVVGAAAFVMPYVYALSSSSTGSGGSGTSGASGAAATGSKPGAGGKGDNQGSSSSSSSSSGSSSGSGSSSPPPKNPPPKNPPPKPKTCVPGKCVGDPGYYTTNGHHHCFDGSPGCKCTDPHKCTVGSAFIRPGSIMTTV